MPDDQFGRYGLSIDGDSILIGKNFDDDDGTNSGSAYVFVRDNGVWSQQAKLIDADVGPGDHFGRYVSISGDTAVVAATYDDDGVDNSGSVFVFTRSGEEWSLQAKLKAPLPTNQGKFGTSVSVSEDTLVVGTWEDVVDEGQLLTAAGSALRVRRQ